MHNGAQRDVCKGLMQLNGWSTRHLRPFNRSHLSKTQDSTVAEGPRDALSVEILSTVAQPAHEKSCNRWITVTIIQGHRQLRDSIGHNHFLLVGFRDITTFMAYVTAACDLEKSFRFVGLRQLKLLVAYTFVFVYKHIAVNTCCFSLNTRLRKVPNSSSHLQGQSRSFVFALFDEPHMKSC